MNTYTKEEFEQMNAPEPTVEQKRTVATKVAKRIYDWQEKQGIYAFDADACEAGCGVIITPLFEAFHTPKGSEVEEVAEFRRTEDCTDPTKVSAAATSSRQWVHTRGELSISSGSQRVRRCQ